MDIVGNNCGGKTHHTGAFLHTLFAKVKWCTFLPIIQKLDFLFKMTSENLDLYIQLLFWASEANVVIQWNFWTKFILPLWELLVFVVKYKIANQSEKLQSMQHNSSLKTINLFKWNKTHYVQKKQHFIIRWLILTIKLIKFSCYFEEIVVYSIHAFNAYCVLRTQFPTLSLGCLASVSHSQSLFFVLFRVLSCADWPVHAVR